MLIAIDIDGTLEWSHGPVKVETLKRLQKGHIIVGGSGHPAPIQVLEFRAKGIRLKACPRKDVERLKTLKRKFKAEDYIFVGDDHIDREVAEEAGYRYLTPQEFENFAKVL